MNEVNRAFIFDMDGVLVDSERWWESHDKQLSEQFFDAATREKIGSAVGVGVRGLYEKAVAFGAPVSFEELSSAYNAAAMKVYDDAPLTEGTERLVTKLLEWGFKLGLVTSSPQSWIDRVIPRLPFVDKLECIISLGERSDIAPKPSPDGYREALRTLGADPDKSFIIEDSNTGIKAAKAAGVYVIGFSGNLIEGYKQTGADAYADTMDDVMTIVEHFNDRQPDT
ncbi:MAG: HAD family phosphatase [Patescibacteria group bacterium]|nr:HAD family phosphatase [Patescibacteria group bacterium]